MARSGVLIALDSVGIDPLGHGRPESVYAGSRFLFPRGAQGEVLALPDAPAPGALAETDVTGGREQGAIECAITYASIFTGIDALERHGLMQGLGLSDGALEAMVAERNLFSAYASPCLANAHFPVHLPCFREGYLDARLPAFDRAHLEAHVTWRGEPVKLTGRDKRGFAELFTLCEINQNVFVHAALEAGVPLLSYDHAREGRALTSSLTRELEAEFDLSPLGIEPLPVISPEDAAGILGDLAAAHDFVFYKDQIPDLVSHTGRVDLARATFATVERFLGALLERLPGVGQPDGPIVVVTSDHGHLEQVGFEQGHPKSKVPTWYFGPDPVETAARLRTPTAIFDLFAGR
jgi:hypothetical protein